LPDCYLFSNPEKTHFYIAGEIPKEIHDIEDTEMQRNELTAWWHAILRIKYGFPNPERDFKLDFLPPSHPDAELKNKLVTTVFAVDLKRTNQAAYPLSGGHDLIELGDAYKDPNLHLTHGTVDAIRNAKLLAKNRNSDGSFNIDQYNLWVGFCLNSMVMRMKDGDAQVKQFIKDSYYDQIKVEGNKLLLIAQSAPQTEALQKASLDFAKAVRGTDYDNIYDTCMSLDIALTESLTEAWVSQLDSQIEAKKQNIQRLQNGAFRSIKDVTSFIGGNLQHRIQRLEVEIQNIQKQKFTPQLAISSTRQLGLLMKNKQPTDASNISITSSPEKPPDVSHKKH